MLKIQGNMGRITWMSCLQDPSLFPLRLYCFYAAGPTSVAKDAQRDF